MKPYRLTLCFCLLFGLAGCSLLPKTGTHDTDDLPPYKPEVTAIPYGTTTPEIHWQPFGES